MAQNEVMKQRSADMFSLLKKYEKQIEASIPKHLTVETMLRLVVGAFNKNPKLLECTPSSVLNSVIYLAQIGLQPRVNEAYLIPYKGVCTPVIDYRGKIKLARQSKLVKDIEPHLVCEGDKFELTWSSDPQRRCLVHEPLLFKRNGEGRLQRTDSKERGLPVLGYAIGWLVDSDPHTEVMTFADIEKIRQKSPASGSGPWVTDWDQMALKTLVHRLCKMLPQSAEIQMAQELDDRADMGISIDPIVELSAADDRPMVEGHEEDDDQSQSSLADRVKSAAGVAKTTDTPKDTKETQEQDHSTSSEISFESWDALKAAHDGDENAVELGKIITVGGKSYTRESYEHSWSVVTPIGGSTGGRKRNTSALNNL